MRLEELMAAVFFALAAVIGAGGLTAAPALAAPFIVLLETDADSNRAYPSFRGRGGLNT